VPTEGWAPAAASRFSPAIYGQTWAFG
jgi:hypothetical protein